MKQIIFCTSCLTILFISATGLKADKNTPVLITDLSSLPPLTHTMQQNLLKASQQGDLEEIRDLFETNELTPVLGKDHVSNPIDYWKSQSIDGTARDTLANIAEVFSLPPVKTTEGDYVWPYLARWPLDKLTPAQQIDLFRLAGPKQASEMLKNKKYSHFEAKIGKDGTWHSFERITPAPSKQEQTKK